MEERRLFVGMLNRDLNEDNVKGLFLPYGTVEEVSVLRDGEGRSKGNVRPVTVKNKVDFYYFSLLLFVGCGL